MGDPKIKFSHIYQKLMVFGGTGGSPVPCTRAKLLQVLTVTIEELSKLFIDYDTDFNKYKLAYDTLYLMLIFQKPDGNIFTTLRPMSYKFGDKRKYYQELVGKDFEVVIPAPQPPMQYPKPTHSLYHEHAEAQHKIQRDLK